MNQTLHRTSLLFAATVLILLLGWALRVHAIEVRSFWADEGWTMLLSEGPGLDDVTRTLAADQHPPLFFAAFRLWRGAAGDSEFATRAFSALIGMLAVAGMVPLGRGLYGPLVGVLAALLLALADNHIDLSQEVRHYSLLTTLAIASSLFYVRWWRRPTRASRIGYVLASIALLYTHYLGGFVLAAQLVHLLATARPWRRLEDGLFLFGATCLGFLPWLPVVLDQNRLRWENPLYYQNALPNSLETYRAVRAALLGSHYGLLAGLLLVGLVYLVYRRGEGEPRVRVRWRPVWPAFYLAVWIGLMAGLTVLINEQRQFLTVRNFILVTPPILLLVAHGLDNLDRVARWLLVSVIAVVSLTTVDARRHYPDWRALTRTVAAYHGASEPVLMDVWVGDFAVRYYVDRQLGEATPRVSLREWRDTYRDQFLPRLLDYLRPLDSFWLVYWGDPALPEYGSVIGEAGFERTATFSIDHLGSPIYSFRYDRATDAVAARFGDALTLRRFALPAPARAGQPIDVALWWTADQPLALDYSISVMLFDGAGNRVVQQDSAPLDGASPTSAWEPGALKFDAHRLALPAGLPPGEYELGVLVYWYGDRVPLPATGPGTPPGDYAALGTVAILP